MKKIGSNLTIAGIVSGLALGAFLFVVRGDLKLSIIIFVAIQVLFQTVKYGSDNIKR